MAFLKPPTTSVEQSQLIQYLRERISTTGANPDIFTLCSVPCVDTMDEMLYILCRECEEKTMQHFPANWPRIDLDNAVKFVISFAESHNHSPESMPVKITRKFRKG